MTEQVQLRRGTTAQHATFTGALGEVTVDTDKKVTVVHDGSAAGGFPGVRLGLAQTFTAEQTFSTINVGTLTATNAPTGAGVTALFASPPALGGTVAAAVKGTTGTFTGLLDISAAGAGQIVFPATQNASSNANTLDDYEEGTLTPVLTAATPGDLAVTYGSQVGTYTKIGNMVLINGNIQTSAFTYTTASGAARITGLPFAAAAVLNVTNAGALAWSGITKASYTSMALALANSSSILTVLASGSGVGIATLAITEMPSAGVVNLRFNMAYQA